MQLIALYKSNQINLNNLYKAQVARLAILNRLAEILKQIGNYW